MAYSIAQLNQLSQADFTRALGAVFEATPAIAQIAWESRPFSSIDDLHQNMVAVVLAMAPAAQLALIRAHPQLGSKVKMADASIQEQAGVGLDRLTPPEYDRFQALNGMYNEKFGFPFIIAVKNHTKASILDAFSQRLDNSPETEIQQALTEIFAIARFRLDDLVES